MKFLLFLFLGLFFISSASLCHPKEDDLRTLGGLPLMSGEGFLYVKTMGFLKRQLDALGWSKACIEEFMSIGSHNDSHSQGRRKKLVKTCITSSADQASYSSTRVLLETKKSLPLVLEDGTLFLSLKLFEFWLKKDDLAANCREKLIRLGGGNDTETKKKRVQLLNNCDATTARKNTLSKEDLSKARAQKEDEIHYAEAAFRSAQDAAKTWREKSRPEKAAAAETRARAHQEKVQALTKELESLRG